MTLPVQAPLLDVCGLRVSFSVPAGTVIGVADVSLQLKAGETLGIVGESGSGKSVTTFAMMGLLAQNGHVAAGDVRFDGRDILHDKRALRAVRGREVAFIFQNPRAALNPILSVGEQIRHALRASRTPPRSRKEGRDRAIELLEMVRINKAAERYDAYPHQLSGGMCQRVLIAMAFAAEPRLLIADEPTTGLDVTTQRVIMDILRDLAARRRLATILITHDLGLAAEACERLLVMSGGRIVEQGPTAHVLASPKVDYTRRLIAATPHGKVSLLDLLPPAERIAFASVDEVSIQADDRPHLRVEGLGKSFAGTRRHGLLGGIGRLFARARPDETADDAFWAVNDVSFAVARGEALGIVGESGSGKTTTSRMIARLLDPGRGEITFDDREIGRLPARQFAHSTDRRRIQVVFQDPAGSLNPRFTSYEAIRDPLRRCGGGLGGPEEERILQAAERAGLDHGLLDRYPHQLSGGQQARVGIARALVVDPEILILDEPTSALDVSVQAVVLNQLAALRKTLGLTLIFVSHDLEVVRLLCDRVVVMRHGRIVESGPTAQVFERPAHEYTRELLAAIPRLGQAEALPSATSQAS
ncbi:dipeptide ABC transporter ATP-binding protein [Bradyrhizobium elkanii]|uniref:dipeptide ABC transporter ATP-binding protein n=1 Tax=Bradyrhizobium elkanii TaxID=29448 RepID=UPI003517410D